MDINWAKWRKSVIMLLGAAVLFNINVLADEGKEEAEKKKQKAEEKEEEEWKGNALKIVGDGADYFFYIDFEGMRDSAMYQTLQGKAQKKKSRGQLSIRGSEKFKAACKRFIEITGLERKDLSRLGVSGSISELDFSQDTPLRFSNTVWTSALDLKQPLSFDKLKTLMHEYVEEINATEKAKDVTFKLAQSKYKKHKIFNVTVEPQKKSVSSFEVAVTLSRTKRSLFMGTPSRVKAVLKQNLAEELVAEFPEGLKAAKTLKASGADVYNVFAIPSNLRTKLEEVSDAISQENKKRSGSTQEEFLGTLGSLQTLRWRLQFAEALTVNIQSSFGKANDAARVNYLLENVVFGILRATLVSASSGRAVPLLTTLENRMPDEKSVRMHVKITETDVEILQQILQRQLNSFQEMNRTRNP